MKLHFPLFTSGRTKDFGYREIFWKVVESEYSDLFVISPFIDSKIFHLIFRKAIRDSQKKTLTLISRPPDNESRRKDFQLITDHLDANRTRYRLGRGNLVNWYFDSTLHAKALIADYRTVIFGSQNITFNGLGDDLNKSRCNDELGAYIEELDGTTADQLKQYVSILIGSSTQIYPSNS